MIMAHEVLNAMLTARAAVVLAAPPAPTGGAPALRVSAIPRSTAVPPGAPTLRVMVAPVGAPAGGAPAAPAG